jgi:hypothetical protein
MRGGEAQRFHRSVTLHMFKDAVELCVAQAVTEASLRRPLRRNSTLPGGSVARPGPQHHCKSVR